MKIGDKVKIINMINYKEKYNGCTGVVTSFGPANFNVGVTLDGDSEEKSVLSFQVKIVEE